MLFRFAFMLLFCLSSLEAKIIETKHIDDVLPLIDEDTWFLVDLDNCMFQGAQALGHPNWFYDELQQRMQKGLSREEAISDAYPHWIKTQRVCKVKPLEENFAPTLLLLQNKEITIMGLTHRQPSVADSTARQVNSFWGLIFLYQPHPKIHSSSQPRHQHCIFKGFYSLAITIKKSISLSLFSKSPRKIVFIDDKRKNVEELEALTKHGIEYIGVHYTAI